MAAAMPRLLRPCQRRRTGRQHGPGLTPGSTDIRVDTWLWTARLLKTRAAANDAVKGNLVRVNGTPVKPSREISAGDEVRLTLGPIRRTVIVRGMAPRRVSAAEAAKLYEETADSLAERERAAEMRRLSAPRIEHGGRPTKRDRRRYGSQGR